MLTEKGKQALELIFLHYTELEKFTCKELKEKTNENIASATLTGIVNEGYLLKQMGSPTVYWLKQGAKEDLLKRSPKSFSPYSFIEFKSQQKLSYNELCQLLIEKYGVVDGNYFCKENCSSPNPKIKRGKEGLDIHHIKEDTYIMLSNPKFAVLAPFECQKGHNLVYCNDFEHLLLHIKIVEECKISQIIGKQLPGLGGIINFIGPKLASNYKINKKTICNIKETEFQTIINNFFKQYPKYEMAKLYDIKDVKKLYKDRADEFTMYSLLKPLQ